MPVVTKVTYDREEFLLYAYTDDLQVFPFFFPCASQEELEALAKDVKLEVELGMPFTAIAEEHVSPAEKHEIIFQITSH